MAEQTDSNTLLSRRTFLRTLNEMLLLSAAAGLMAGCGGSRRGVNVIGEMGGVLMANEGDMNSHLAKARRLLDEAELHKSTLTEPRQQAELATQIAIGHAVLVLAERMATLGDRVGGLGDHLRSLDNLSYIADDVDDLADAVENLELKT